MELNKLRQYIKFALLEGRIDDVKAKYPDVDIDFLASQDPSANNKYLDWMAQQINNGHRIEDLAPTILYFHRNISRFKRRDLQKDYPDLKDLENAIKDLEINHHKGRSDNLAKQIKSTADASTILTTPNEYVVFTNSKESACSLGSGTQWCITMKDADYYEQYTGANTLFYYVLKIVPKRDEFDKIALAVERSEDNDINDITAFTSDDTEYQHNEFKKFIPEEITAAVRKHATNQPKGLIAKIKSGDASDEEIESALVLYKDEPSVTAMIAREVNSSETLMRLVKDNVHDENMLIAVSNNRNAPHEVLEIFAQSEYSQVRARAAMSWHTPPEILTKLASDQNFGVQVQVSHNRKTPPEILAHMVSYNVSYNITSNIAGNSSTPLETLKKLAQSPDDGIRRAVSKNQGTPIEILELLMYDKNIITRKNVAIHRNASTEIIKQLAQDESSTVPIAIAELEGLPSDVYMILANHKLSDVKLQLASNQKVPSDILAHLANTTSQYIQREICHNDNVSPETLDFLARDPVLWPDISINKAASGALLEIFAKSHKVQLRCDVASHRNTFPKTLAFLSDDFSFLVRQLVARNFHTPPEVLNKFFEKEPELHYFLKQNKSVTDELFTKLLSQGEID